MGCTPSRGNNFNGTHGPFTKGKTLLPGNNGTTEDGQSDDERSVCSAGGETDGKACEKGTKAGQKLESSKISATLVKKNSVGEPGAAKLTSERLDTQEITINLTSQRKEKHIEKEDEKKYEKRVTKKSKNQKNAKPSKKKDKGKKSTTEKKVDFPEQLVKSHQAAYGYLNPSIDKYELLLGLLDHATQTHISLQPMVAFMALRYEEFNQGLEEIVKKGEQLLKDNGGHLAWPYSGKSSSTEPQPDLLQQLLQYTVQRMHLVGQSVKRIGDTALEDAVDYFSSICEVLEEKLNAKHAVEARLMKLLNRIEVASQQRTGPEDSALFSEDSGIGVESASLAGSDRKHHRRESCESTESSRTVIFSPANSTPIHQSSKRHQSSKINSSSSVTSFDSTCTLKNMVFRDTESLLDSSSLDDGEVENEDNSECNEEEHCGVKMRMRSSSSPLDPSYQTQCMLPKRIENPHNVEMTMKMRDAISERINFISSQHAGKNIKPQPSKANDQRWMEEGETHPIRPQTATQTAKKKTTVTKQRRSRSAESLRSKADDPTLLELERAQKEISKRLEKMGKLKIETKVKKEISKQWKQTQFGQLHPVNVIPSNSQQKALSEKIITVNPEDEKEKIYKTVKGPMKATSALSPLPATQELAMCPRGNSVKKLIDTFSQGMEESKQFHESSKEHGPLKGVRKYGIPVIPGLTSEDAPSCKKNSINNQKESTTLENQDYINLDNLPPPPLEVLMDNSFENVEIRKADEKLNRRGRSTFPKTTSMSQRLRTSMQSVTVLPSKGSVRKSSRSISPAQNITLHPSGVSRNSQVASTPNADLRNEEAVSLYKQARKIIHLRYSSNSPTEKPAVDNVNIQQITQHSIEGNRQDKKSPERVPSSSVGNHSPDTSGVSKTRMLPSTPVVHRRLPSPPVFKKQTIPSSSSSPLILRKLPTPPPSSQKQTLPTSNNNQDKNTLPSCISGVTYPFKAPSPPASPKVQRRSRENNSEDSASRVFSNARSVFCPVSPSLFEAQPFLVPKPPQAWTSSGSSILPRPWGERGRLLMSVRGPFIRRSQSDRRPSLSHPPRASVVSIAQSCGSEPAISTQGLEDGPLRDRWNKPLELREANRSSSHPDLCIVGQALQCE